MESFFQIMEGCIEGLAMPGKQVCFTQLINIIECALYTMEMMDAILNTLE